MGYSRVNKFGYPLLMKGKKKKEIPKLVIKGATWLIDFVRHVIVMSNL